MRHSEIIVEGLELLPALHQEAVEGGQIPGSPGPRAVPTGGPGRVMAVPEPHESDPRCSSSDAATGPTSVASS
jgi:hypothetical protein